MKVAIVGLRGFPQVQGGVEKHVESLSPLLVQQGVAVTVYARSPYMRHLHQPCWQGVRLRRIWCPTGKSTETLVHTFLSVWAAFFEGHRVIHFQAIGPSFFVPMARLLGMRVVMTHHGCDYQRQKWGWLARCYLRAAEALAVRYAHQVIVISHSIQRFVDRRYGAKSVWLPNGVSAFPDHAIEPERLRPFDLPPGQFILHVGRFVPEKRHHDLIDAFVQADLPGWKLVFVGAADHEDAYSSSVLARATGKVRFVGRQMPAQLLQLYAQCGLFVLPSSHEGLPIALLEAMSLGAPFLVSDIDAHTELELPAACYFPLGDVATLAQRIRQRTASPNLDRSYWAQWARERFDWCAIAERTATLYRQLVRADSAVQRAD
ncbi:glycosyltransferase family 4 protein [Paludibacterium purpuratum]|uniref:Glycosyltransferase involved in cell wall biosynthesis n=1 Tax=Paludibacterium purpuratum TaxID=1144873 RepID=A0A4R7B4N9_9NEIS|nr:glycosyltransferase family 4 protein [Paludibacterium purpuratum]TDR77813.1 glycosyltransferase involved in cell wall biosynthesis [Paludibacterium purpuratum]